ncbi:MAG: ThuA domain-containing protein [Chitinophagaceae bacterium]|nr:ThuA domain-containing protein [Chitinophagaceae bacterium]
MKNYSNKKLLFITLILLTSIAITAFSIDKSPQKKRSVVFLITKDTNNYEAHRTIPKFAALLEKEHGYKTTVLLGTGTHGDYRYESVDAIKEADLLIIMARRIALPHDQMQTIKNYVSSGKPVIGIRTAHHAFHVMETIQDGHEDWPAFTADILGCENKGYGPHDAGYEVSTVSEAASHPILKNVAPSNWHSKGGIYHVQLLDKNATVLLKGEVEGKTEPIAWTRTAGKNKVFYISMGYPDDFETEHFRRLLINGIKWAIQ